MFLRQYLGKNLRTLSMICKTYVFDVLFAPITPDILPNVVSIDWKVSRKNVK